MVPKFRKLLSRERYCKHMLDEDGQIIFPTNPNVPYSSNHIGLMILHDEFDLFCVDNAVGNKKNMFE
jgi:hypothetical protein